MKLKHLQTKGHRLNNQYLCFSAINNDDTSYWYFDELRKWIDVLNSEDPGGEMSTDQDCHSIRAFRRKLKKCPKGIKFFLDSKFVKCYVIGEGTGE